MLDNNNLPLSPPAATTSFLKHAHSNVQNQVINSQDAWSRFYNFASNSRHSDSLVYAQARKEAYIQHTRLLDQSSLADLWTLMALKFILKNRLLFSPGAKALEHEHDKIILDIQGVLNDTWSWQIALDYPTSMVYGYRLLRQVSPTSHSPVKERKNSVMSVDSSHSTSSSTLPPRYSGFENGPETPHGPSNYISCTGQTLRRLPFPDNMFDVVSAKSLWHYVAKSEWEPAIQEFYRVLKPNGYLEICHSDFIPLNIPKDVPDSQINKEKWYWDRVQSGARAINMELDPGRHIGSWMYDSGFDGVERALMCIPKGYQGQCGNLTELLSLYYGENVFNKFANLTSEELEWVRTIGIHNMRSSSMDGDGMVMDDSDDEESLNMKTEDSMEALIEEEENDDYYQPRIPEPRNHYESAQQHIPTPTPPKKRPLPIANRLVLYYAQKPSR